jgi:hypothetical protein
MTLADIEGLAKSYADRRALLAGRLTALERDLNAIKSKHMRELKRHVALTAECHTELVNAIDASPELFDKPKTRILHGIKVGFRKGPGGMDWEDDEDLVRKIEKMFPDDDEAERYLIIKKKPSADALEDLDAGQLKRLGVLVVGVGEQVVVKAVESDVEKLVKALLKGATDDEAEEG